MRKTLLLLFILCVASSRGQSQNQNLTITGRVTATEDKSGLPGVNVLVKGSTQGAVTDSKGFYSVTVPDEGSTLIFSFIGFLTKEIATGGRSTIDVIMEADAKQLSEVVVVGYGEQSRRNSLQAVSTINSDVFKDLPAIGPQQLLQGQAAGVMMVNSSGVLGSNATVRIRGASSISGGSSPLYVVDGVPLNDGGNGNYSSTQGAGAPLNPLMDINPNDIESMTVLKDAAAVAIYGSRGANGVVLIKTKQGSNKEKTKITFDQSFGWSEPTNLYPIMNADQFSTFTNEYQAARGLPITNFPDQGFDWVDGVMRTGNSSVSNLSFSGGSDKTSFFIGLGYHDESGFTIGNDMNRLSGRVNVDHNISKKLKIGLNLSLSNTKSDRIGAENSITAPLTAAYLQQPTVVPYDADGKYTNTGFISNVIAVEALNDNNFLQRRQTGSIYLNWEIVKNLQFRTQFGADVLQSEEQSRTSEVLRAGGAASRTINQDDKWLTTNTLQYDFNKENHTIGLLLGQSFETAHGQVMTTAGTGFVSDQLRNVSSAATKTTTEANETEWALDSYFGRFNYNLKDKYLFETTIRRDGSSRFGEGKRYGNFWAVSGGWVLSEEQFLSGVQFINLLKLTSSVGTSGNDRLGTSPNFPSIALFSSGVSADYAGSPGLIPSQVPNPNLSWEETGQVDVGLSGAFFNSRVSLEVNYYVKTTTGLLASVLYPYTTGFTSAAANVGKMRNTGWDILLNTTNVDKGKFNWTTTLTLGFLKNEVLDLPPNKDAEGRDYLGASYNRAIEGQTQNHFYMVRYHGIDPETGDAQWLTKDGELTSTPNQANDRVDIGSAIPDFTGGFTNNFRYGRFDLNAFFNFSYGNYLLYDEFKYNQDLGNSFNKSVDLLNYWKQPGDNAFAPRLDSQTAAAGIFNQSSTQQLQDGSYLRLKVLSLGYNIPTAILSKTRLINAFRVYVMAQNIWTLTTKNFRAFDPEMSSYGTNSQTLGAGFLALPQAKSVTVGLNLTF